MDGDASLQQIDQRGVPFSVYRPECNTHALPDQCGIGPKEHDANLCLSRNAVSKTTATIAGAAELVKMLTQLGPRIERKITRGAMTMAATPVVRQIKANAKGMVAGGAKRKHGKPHLYQTIGKRTKTYAKKGVVYVAVGPLYKLGGYHGHLVEFGHRIVKGGSIARISGKQRGSAPKAKNPTRTGQGKASGIVRPHPFERPAWEATKQQALNVVVSEHQRRVEIEAKKLAIECGCK